jgi:adenine-specific DNA-methyltransferase
MQRLRTILGKDSFENPKDEEVLMKIIEATTPKDGVVLDAFGGSGTTGHAVLALNKLDSGNRRFILTESQDYADTVTAERIRRVIKGVAGAANEDLKKGYGGTFSYFELGDSLESEKLLAGKNLPNYQEMARYVFYAATGQEFATKKIVEKEFYIGSDASRDVFLIYKPDAGYLRSAALTLDIARALKSKPGRRKIVFAPTKYLDQEQLDELGIDFAQLPYDLYKSLR